MLKKNTDSKPNVARLRSEVYSIKKDVDRIVERQQVAQVKNPFTGLVTGNYWTQTGMPWVSNDGRKAVLTEWFWQT
jgi:hypothetical protein